MSQESIARAENLFDFFHTSIGHAASRQRLAVSNNSLFYLSNLLVERGRSPEASPQEPDTLVDLVYRARAGQLGDSILAWRELGDRALFVTGFFRQSLARRLVGLDYYRDMGASAYLRLSRLLGLPGGEQGGLDDLYEELAEHFVALSDLLQEVREDVRSAESMSDADIVRLYEEWLSTGSPRAAARLRELGVKAAAQRGRGGPAQA